MGHKHTKEEILDGAVALAFDEGLSRLTFGRVAKHLGISDRIVVYYFPTKNDLVSAVVLAIGTELQDTLALAFTEPAKDHLELLRASWPVLATPESDAVFGLFFEANGLATAGLEPYKSLVPSFVEMWIAWTAGFVDGTDAVARTEAETAVALLDGMLLLRQLAGPEAAQRVAERIGVAPPA